MKNNKVYFWSLFNQFLAKPLCLLCQQPSRQSLPLCEGCEQDLPWLNHFCQQCAEPLSPLHQSTKAVTPAMICGHCLKHPPAFSHTYAPLRYEFPIDQLIQRFKHRAEHPYIELLSELFVRGLDKSELQQPRPQQLIPVPLHANRLHQRGFNQSLELAHSIGQRLAIPINDRACSRNIDTPHQQGLTAEQRRRNLRNAFSVNPDLLKRGTDKCHIALIDDVMTTGSTAQVLASMLRQAGADRVDIWCLARTPAGRHSQHGR